VTPLSAPEFADLMAPFAPFEARPELAVAMSTAMSVPTPTD